ncbi:MAG: hypothetical protein HY712_02720 [candidate division NC10 bacterium]|nr:hypothetical protein [candidate division NC10 bacterium]
MTSAPSLFTRPFLFICLATGCFYLSFYPILPVMPLYVSSLGGTPTQIGLIIGYFAWGLGIALGSAASGCLLTFIDFPTLFALITATPLIGAALAFRSRTPHGRGIA